MALIPLAGCAPEPVVLEAARVPGGIDVIASAPITEVRVDGVRRAAAAPTRRLFVPMEVPRGRDLGIEAGGGRISLRVPDLPADLFLELPVGAPPVLLDHGDRVVRAGDPAAGAVVRVVSAGVGTIDVGGREIALGPPGTSVAIPVPAAVPSFTVTGARDAVTVGWRLLDGPPVEIRALAFPVGADGVVDPARAADTVVPPPRWAALEGPWAHAAVTVANPAPAPRAVTVRLAIDDPAFAHRAPGAPTAEASAVLALPAGGVATAVLPVSVDPRAVRPGPVPVAVVVTDAGGSAPVAARRATWWVASDDGAAIAFLASLPVSAAGLLGIAVGGPRFLRRTPVPALTLVACLGAVTFVVGAAFQLVGLGVAAVLGPFAPFLTALFDDLFRVALLAALVTRVPRPGVAAAAATIGFLMRGVTLGGFHPADLHYLGTQVALGEAFLWGAGLTRGDAWKAEPPWRRTLRLVAGFAPAQAIGVALGLVATQALYRLYWAPGYAAALVLLPGFLYVVLAVALSAPLAAELDRVVE